MLLIHFILYAIALCSLTDVFVGGWSLHIVPPTSTGVSVILSPGVSFWL